MLCRFFRPRIPLIGTILYRKIPFVDWQFLYNNETFDKIRQKNSSFRSSASA